MIFDQIQYNGEALTAAKPAIIGLPLPRNLTIETFLIWVAAVLEADATFNIQKNGVDLFEDPLTIPAGQKFVKIPSLNFVCLEGDLITLDFLSGSVGKVITLGIGYPENFLPPGDLSADNKIEKLFGKEVYLPMQDGFADDFAGTSLDTNKWLLVDEGYGTGSGFWEQNDGLFIKDSIRFSEKVKAIWGDGSFFQFKYEHKLRDDDHILLAQFEPDSGGALGVTIRSIIINNVSNGGDIVGHGYDETVARWIHVQQVGGNIVFSDSTDGNSFTTWKTAGNSWGGLGRFNFRFVNNNGGGNPPADTVKITQFISNLGEVDPFKSDFELAFDSANDRWVKKPLVDVGLNGKIKSLQGHPVTLDPLTTDGIARYTHDDNQWSFKSDHDYKAVLDAS